MTSRTAYADRPGIDKHPRMRQLRGNLKVAEAASVIGIHQSSWTRYENLKEDFSTRILHDFEAKAIVKYPFYEALK